MASPQQIAALKLRIKTWVKDQFRRHSILKDRVAAILDEIADLLSSSTSPYFIDLEWSMMESSDEIEGARFTYINSVLDGWNPSVISVGGQILKRGEHYDMYAGGVFRLREGYGIFNESFLRFTSYQPYDAPPLPGQGSITLLNQSSTPTTFDDASVGPVVINPAGDFYKYPVIEDQSFLVNVPQDTRLTYTKYDLLNIEISSAVYENTEETILQVLTENMELQINHVFLLSDIEDQDYVDPDYMDDGYVED